MPKAPSTSTSKAATKSVKTKTSKEPKEKRPPSAYNMFVSEKMKSWKADNPGANAKDAMRAVGVMWASAEENPNRGKPLKSRKAKTPKDTYSAPASSSQPPSDENDVPSSDSVNA
ncbi:hypothetical protein J3R30DRAFT_3696975 [Lentinula aciculospora]|uniref:HMG box domain-containing protein n=1 Tax=Lentinula aciculospora TaxID=153920 RepID=A0A9W9DUJ1_9AGAR|nr:hypothetical protein J3R30DRAFT_3696975 [Lentinula aciculospora]